MRTRIVGLGFSLPETEARVCDEPRARAQRASLARRARPWGHKLDSVVRGGMPPRPLSQEPRYHSNHVSHFDWESNGRVTIVTAESRLAARHWSSAGIAAPQVYGQCGTPTRKARVAMLLATVFVAFSYVHARKGCLAQQGKLGALLEFHAAREFAQRHTAGVSGGNASCHEPC
jgi:hypothetical protein